MIDEQKLRELAEAAKGWSMDKVHQGPEDLDMGIALVGAENDDGTFAEVMQIDTGLYFAEEQAALLAHFYAAANPAAILALLDELQSLRSERTTKNTEGSEMNSETSKLQETKECPFCGNSWGRPQAEVDKESGRWTVGCMNPRCGASSGYCDTEDEAVNLWNTRAGEAQ